MEHEDISRPLIASCCGRWQKLYTDFELQGVVEENLNSKMYQSVSQRMQTEEATCALTMGMKSVKHLHPSSKLLQLKPFSCVSQLQRVGGR